MVTAAGNVSFHGLNKIKVTKAQLVTSGRSTRFPGTADPHRPELAAAVPAGFCSTHRRWFHSQGCRHGDVQTLILQGQ